MNITSIIENLIKESLTSLSLEVDEIFLEHPQDLKMGDFSCNAAMMLSKKVGKNPRELAQEIVSKIEENEYVEKVEVAGPGFINFYLSKKFYVDFVKGADVKPDFLNGIKVLIEHSSPNLFKPFHIGHMVNNSIGESLVRIYQYCGADVTKLSFPSDKSLGISKTVWGLKQMGIDNPTIDDFGKAYVLGTEKYDSEDKSIKTKIDQINLDIYNEEGENFEIYKSGVDKSRAYFLDFTKRIGSEFDQFYYESECEKVGKEVIKENTPKVFEESEGALIFKGSEHGLYDNVFVTGAGYATYSGKDIGLLKLKFDNNDFDKSITVADIEQKGHFNVVKKAAEFVNQDWSDKTEYIMHGRLGFTGGEKVSSRFGNVPMAEVILEDLKKVVKERILEKTPDYDESILEEVSEKISLSAIKFSVLKVSAGKNMTFDTDKSVSTEGDSGPYLQYAYVRAHSILNKVENVSSEFDSLSREVSDFEKVLYRFPEALKKSVEDYSPHHVAGFLFTACDSFNSFYASERILDEENPDYLYNISLVKKFSDILKEGLNTLGIDVVEKM